MCEDYKKESHAGTGYITLQTPVLGGAERRGPESCHVSRPNRHEGPTDWAGQLPPTVYIAFIFAQCKDELQTLQYILGDLPLCCFEH